MAIPFRMSLVLALLAFLPSWPLSTAAQRGLDLGVPAHRDAGYLARMAPLERQDFGVPPIRQLHDGPAHGPTPASIPGGRLVTTEGLVEWVQGGRAPYVIVDVLGHWETLPGAVAGVWLAQPGGFGDDVQRQAEQLFGQWTRGDKDVALVFYCLSRECWMSYNAALRAIQAGYRNVLWYRGGLEAWKAAGLPTQPPVQSSPPRFTPVDPVSGHDAGAGPGADRAPGELRIGQGRFFSFALPPGWRVGEDGQFALTLLSPDDAAMTVMVGNAGLAIGYPPQRFAFEKLSVLNPRNLQLGNPRQSTPASGFDRAVEFDVSFYGQRGPQLGIAKVSMVSGYDSSVMAMTASLAPAQQWHAYASWLPMVADQVAAHDGAAFGRHGIMQQNLQNSIAFGEAARRYREWSQRTWQGVTDDRLASQDRRGFATRELLGGVQTFNDPFGVTGPVEMPTSHRYYWQDRDGRRLGTDDPGADPNVGSTGEWRRMERVVR